MMHWYGWDGMGAFGWIGMALMIAFWFGLIALVLVVLIKLVSSEPSTDRPRRVDEDRSVVILRERFARGEITETEFREVQRTLEPTTR